MKSIIFLSMIMCGSFSLFAQTNILEQMGEKQIGYRHWIEKGDYYYFISKQVAGVANPLTGYTASQYILNKYDKNTLQRLDWKVVVGDTLQNDSVVAFGPALFLQGDRFYIQYTKYRASFGFIRNSEYYKQVKADFSNALEEKRFGEDYYIDFVYFNSSSPLENGNFFIGYRTLDSFNSSTSGYFVLDTLGNIIRNGQPGLVITGGPTSKSFRGFFPLGNHQYLEYGTSFARSPAVTNAPYLVWCLVDEEMNLLDTFAYKKGLVQSDTPINIGVAPTSIVLPSGSIISANSSFNHQYIDGREVGYPLITKHTKASRYGVDKYITFDRLDSTDNSHGGFHAPRQLAYNPEDNKLYFGYITHLQEYGLQCSANSDKAYLEVICTDTNLNVNWRKFIKMGGICSDLGTLSVPDDRPGVLVAGYSFVATGSDSASHWVYYIDDNTPSVDPTAISEIAANEKMLHIYPNPTSDQLQITSEEHVLQEVQLFDISGRLLYTQSIHSQRTALSLASFKNGIYLLKCYDRKGNVYVRRIVKQ